ncbi:SDR family NAD(P)-dependent oxidoreductase [Mesorhizobium sp. YIM 152430]|uniref:SDR family NAD(P)-dependent oxidoreductase n=1 Tax=Mesorhizobium sp. YIM 152430 TaxID=3031761 RepID=UPI0023D9B968|nr:SDR family oxidoreductase [Mesorhizobium sp. YIM 152430]MDF1599179.1 SDR family NAD(P)-dependent oxidoreductase [Mesorhizobium sp. YIM 152430]
MTGASSGIGLAVARQLAAQGHRVAASGRRPQGDLPTDFPDIPYHAIDLSHGSAALRLIDQVDQAERDILCAGAGYYRGLADESAVEIERIVAVNLTAQMRLARALYPMLSANHRRLGLVGSVAHKGASTMPVYSATKAALDGFGRSLALVWQGHVMVRVLHPGPTATGMAERAGRTDDWLSRLMLPPASVAAMIVGGLERDRGYRRTLSYGRYVFSTAFAKAVR